jgi:hypothetical protein
MMGTTSSAKFLQRLVATGATNVKLIPEIIFHNTLRLHSRPINYYPLFSINLSKSDDDLHLIQLLGGTSQEYKCVLSSDSRSFIEQLSIYILLFSLASLRASALPKFTQSIFIQLIQSIPVYGEKPKEGRARNETKRTDESKLAFKLYR